MFFSKASIFETQFVTETHQNENNHALCLKDYEFVWNFELVYRDGKVNVSYDYSLVSQCILAS